MTELTIETQQILELAHENHCFLLSGGAGSGKTYTLVETIRALTQSDPSSRIACITYTNAAADEIQERVDSRSLWVSTIHDFMWEQIKRHQNELQQILQELIESDAPEHKIFSIPGGNNSVDDTLFSDLADGIQYREYVRIRDGIISHDEILVVAHKMFERFPKLCRIVKDLYSYIFVDEYQDTSPLVVNILLDSIKRAESNCVIGFFGDAMQAIYQGTVGSLHDRVDSGELKEVKKEQNRRNPLTVINLANQLRNDGLEQWPSNDPKAPNMVNGVVREGKIRFFYSSSSSLENIRKQLNWGEKGVKELNLTHNLIASQAGFGKLMKVYDGDKVLGFVKRIKDYLKANIDELDPEGMTFGEVVDALQEGKTGKELKRVSPTPGMSIFIKENPEAFEAARDNFYWQISKLYVSKDQLVDDTKDSSDVGARPGSQRDELMKHLFRIQSCIHAYQSHQYGEFVKLTDFSLRSVKDKITLKNAVEAIANDPKLSIGAVIEMAADAGLVKKDDRLLRFQEKKKYIYERVIILPYVEFQNLYAYLEGSTPFSTQHKTKGREYQKVLVVLDNGGWTHYNFKNLFEGEGTESVLERTSKIFYVCCTRAKEELAVFYHNPGESIVTKAKEWFGEENIVNMDIAI